MYGEVHEILPVLVYVFLQILRKIVYKLSVLLGLIFLLRNNDSDYLYKTFIIFINNDGTGIVLCELFVLGEPI